MKAFLIITLLSLSLTTFGFFMDDDPKTGGLLFGAFEFILMNIVLISIFTSGFFSFKFAINKLISIKQ